MKTRTSAKSDRRGSALITVMLVCGVLSMLALSSLSYSLQSYRSSMRQNLLDQTKLSAEGEMEFLYFKWKNQLLENTAEAVVVDALKGNGNIVDFATIATESTAASTNDSTFEISRALRMDGNPKIGTSVVSGSTRTALITYYTALTRSKITNPVLGNINYQMGRRFAISKTSLFQFSVFYQDVMEFSTGSSMTIKGNITANGALYIGSQPGKTLTVVDKLFFATSFNGATTAAGAQDASVANLFRYGSDVPNTLSNPIFSSNTDQAVARANQIKKLESVENFLGGTDVSVAMASYGPSGTGAYATTNDIYRSVIAPEPTNSSGAVIDEDPVINANRMYNKAGIIIEVRKTTDSLYSTHPVKIYAKSAPSTDYAITNPDLYNSIIASVRTPVYDSRERTYVNITTVDVGKFKDALNSSNTPAALRNAYNGILYVYDTNPQSEASSSASAVLNGIRLKNAAELPYQTNSSGNPVGFTVASDNGIYIQGDYNTSNPQGAANTDSTAGNPAAIMADAITLLSANWDDSKSAADVTTKRIATTTTVYAALLSGNTPTNTTTATNSGGVQNLIRLMENWTGQDVNLVGSLGQLFASKYFTAGLRATGSVENIYLVPGMRTLTFDEQLASSPPSGSPNTTKFTRGDYFIWQLNEDPSSL